MDLGNCSIINKEKKKQQDLRYRGFPQKHRSKKHLKSHSKIPS